MRYKVILQDTRFLIALDLVIFQKHDLFTCLLCLILGHRIKLSSH